LARRETRLKRIQEAKRALEERAREEAKSKDKPEGKAKPRIVDLKRDSKVAILYSNDSRYGIRFMPFSDHADYGSVMGQMYGALYRANVSVDFVFPEGVDFSKYRLVVVPPLYVASDELLDRLAGYVRNGGHVVMAFKSGFTNEFDTVRWTTAPGPLREAAGFHYQEFSNLKGPTCSQR
jgi:beta-galactosidase